jgi:hypothetical protein
VSKGSFGQGGELALNFNWFSKKDIGFGLKLNTHFSTALPSSDDVYYTDGTSAHFDFTDKAFSFQFIPHISFKHDFKVVTPILEMGMIAGLNDINESYTATLSSGDFVQSSLREHGGVMLGFYSSLGLAFKISKVVRFMLVVNCHVASYSPTHWNRTLYNYDNMNQMSYLPTNIAQGVYVNQINQTAPPSASQPAQELKYSTPFSNVGLSIGFSFVISKKKATHDAEDKNGNIKHPF